MIRAVMGGRQDDFRVFWSRLVPFAPLFVSSVLAIPSSPIRIYAALYALLAAFQAASRVINDHVRVASQRRRQEDMWSAIQGFMTIIALVAQDHKPTERPMLHRQLNQVALAAAQRAGMRRSWVVGERDKNPPSVVFYLLRGGDTAVSGDAAAVVRELRRYQWRGFKNGEEPEASFVTGRSGYATQMVDLALESEARPLFGGGPEGDRPSVSCLTVSVRHDELAWGVLRVESSERKAFTITDGVYLTVIATGLAQALTLLGDDADALLNYSEGSESVADSTDDGGSDHE